MVNILRAVNGRPENKPPQSPERIALAEAIKKHAHAVRSFDATEKAIEDARARTYLHRGENSAEARVERAKAAVETAKANAVSYLTEQMLGTAGGPPMSVKDARAALVDAQEDLEALHSALAALEANLPKWENEIKWSRSRVTEAIREVVCSEPGIRKLLTKFEAAKEEMRQRRQEILWFAERLMIPDEFKYWDSMNFWNEATSALSERAAPWKEAIDQLSVNSEAPLPSS